MTHFFLLRKSRNATTAIMTAIMTARSRRNPTVDQTAGGKSARTMVLAVDAVTWTVSDASDFTTVNQ